LAERLSEYLPAEAVGTAREAADVPVLVLDGPPPVTRELAHALVAGGAFAYLDERRLVVVARRDALLAAGAFVGDGARAVADELVRALEADRARATSLRLRAYTLGLAGRARVMGILNVTPDSFYDRGKYRGVERARERALEMVALGADLIDIGGQSYAHWNPPLAEEEERERVVPVVEALVRDGLGVPLSIDTFGSGVAEAALAAGADLINDCSGLADPKLAATVARYDAGLVVMHLRGRLNVREADYRYADALGELLAFLRERTEHALAAGVARDALVVDPGLEFGKEPRTDLEILERFGDLRSLGYPILFAASRKSFIGRVFNRPADELLVPSLATAALGIVAGAGLVRVHDVAETVELATMLAAVRKDNRTLLEVAPMPRAPAAPP
jgi:dihydropteroate synthase